MGHEFYEFSRSSDGVRENKFAKRDTNFTNFHEVVMGFVKTNLQNGTRILRIFTK
jgi:hypothetical protein